MGYAPSWGCRNLQGKNMQGTETAGNRIRRELKLQGMETAGNGKCREWKLQGMETEGNGN